MLLIIYQKVFLFNCTEKFAEQTELHLSPRKRGEKNTKIELKSNSLFISSEFFIAALFFTLKAINFFLLNEKQESPLRSKREYGPSPITDKWRESEIVRRKLKNRKSLKGSFGCRENYMGQQIKLRFLELALILSEDFEN